VQNLVLDQKLTEELHELSRREGVSFFTTLLAAFQVLLMRYSGQEDVLVGTTIKGRCVPETEGLIGFFENMVALRTDLSGDPPFREVLSRAREVTQGACDQGGLPFSKLLEELHPPRSLSHAPLFQVLLRLNAPPETVSLGTLETILLPVHNGRAAFDLTLSLCESEGRLSGVLGYNADLFHASTMGRTGQPARSSIDQFGGGAGVAGRAVHRAITGDDCRDFGTTPPLIIPATAASTNCSKNRCSARLRRWLCSPGRAIRAPARLCGRLCRWESTAGYPA
jgi:hypothetical protein